MVKFNVKLAAQVQAKLEKMAAVPGQAPIGPGGAPPKLPTPTQGKGWIPRSPTEPYPMPPTPTQGKGWIPRSPTEPYPMPPTPTQATPSRAPIKRPLGVQ